MPGEVGLEATTFHPTTISPYPPDRLLLSRLCGAHLSILVHSFRRLSLENSFFIQHRDLALKIASVEAFHRALGKCHLGSAPSTSTKLLPLLAIPQDSLN